MNVLIRPESAQNRPDLMNMLKFATTQMLTKLHNHGLHLPDNSVKIWIKHFSGDKYYPKIEFDADGEELQYDMTHDGEIKETHFKEFQRTPNGTKRVDLNKEFANPLLQQIDNIIRSDAV